MALSQLQTDTINALRAQTYAYITAYMPEWRQMKWNNYITYYRRGINNLEFFEREIAKTMLDEGDDYAAAFERATTGMKWLAKCTKIHDNFEKQIMGMTDEGISGIDISLAAYPSWPL